MTSPAFRAPLAALPLALACAFPCASMAQTGQPSLRPVIVTAPRFAEAADNLPMGVSVITSDEIRTSGAANVTDALVRLIGVPGRQDFFGGGEYNLDLRGFGATADNNQVVILDGQRLSEADLGGTRLSGIPIEAVERIEVLRGSGSVLYGEGATGGVIVITTKAAALRDRRNTASAYAGIGSHGLRDLRANATLAAQGLSLDAAVQKRDADNHRDNFRSELSTGSLTGQWVGEVVRIGATLAQEDLDARLPGALSAADYERDPTLSINRSDYGRIKGTRASVFAQADVGSWQFAADAGRRAKELRSENFGAAYDYDVDAETYALRARHAGTFGSVKNALVVGYDHNRWRREIFGAFGGSAGQSSSAWYVKNDVTLAGGTRFAAGWRTEDIDKDSGGLPLHDTQHAWELGASHPLGAGITAYARLGKSFRLANVDEFSFTQPGVILRPQTSRDVEVGARWVHAAGRAEARLYRSRLADEIGFDPRAPLSFFGANVNFEPTRRQGLEVDVSHALTPSFGLRVNAAVREAKFLSGTYGGKDVPLVPSHTLALRGDWTPGAGHRLTGGVNWVSSQAIDMDNTCTVPGYAVADARYAYQWKNAEFSVGVANLFDRKFFTQAFRCTGGRADAIYPEPGRAFTAAVRVTY